MPLKIERLDTPLGTGAGAGNVSIEPLFVGRKVPETSGPDSGSAVAAASSRTRSTSTASAVPPTSDMTVARWPCGPTSRMSMSSGLRWLTSFSTRLTSVTAVPLLPVTAIVQVDG